MYLSKTDLITASPDKWTKAYGTASPRMGASIATLTTAYGTASQTTTDPPNFYNSKTQPMTDWPLWRTLIKPSQRNLKSTNDKLDVLEVLGLTAFPNSEFASLSAGEVASSGGAKTRISALGVFGGTSSSNIAPRMSKPGTNQADDDQVKHA